MSIEARWSAARVTLEIRDDGPGFAPEVLLRVGEPYVSTRSAAAGRHPTGGTGLGLGLFIAKTLIERSGAQLSLTNAVDPSTGAVVRIGWTRHIFEREVKVPKPGCGGRRTPDAGPRAFLYKVLNILIESRRSVVR